ncbi:MAG TPA: Ig-like domain-containing protein [Verrucomicrobiae bacterium]|jgi:hypothetical protein|nr:Ig-like domain-containing protein [Verrucomicrobiae bacterium]
MKSKSNISLLLRLAAAASCAGLPTLAPATTVWNNLTTTTNYTQPVPHSGSVAACQDRITANVWLTRDSRLPMYNVTSVAALHDGGYNSSVSPKDTEWALGSITNYSTLTYKTWGALIGGEGALHSPLSTYLPGKTFVVHLKTDDIYLQLKFNNWVGGGSGGYSYTRTFSAAVVPPPTVSISSPAGSASFTAPASVTISATASPASGGAAVTNVAFFANSTLVGSATASPFSVTANNLGAGSYSLTAVATAGGVSATSAVVTINVTAPPPPPTVNITAPADGSVYAAPASFTLTADASVTSGSVTNVSFFANSTLLGSASGLFSVSVNNLAAGSYALTAVATAAGISTTSGVVNISVVTPVTASLAAPAATNGQFTFTYSATPGLTYVVQSSSNLVDWTSLSTNQASSGTMPFSDSFDSANSVYYRVGQLPNP